MKQLTLVSAVLLSACSVQKMERFTLRTVDGKEIILVCPVKRVEGDLQLRGGHCLVEVPKVLYAKNHLSIRSRNC